MGSVSGVHTVASDFTCMSRRCPAAEKSSILLSSSQEVVGYVAISRGGGIASIVDVAPYHIGIS